MTHKHVRTIGSALACLFLLSSASFGQFDSGQIAGFVHDDASGTPYGSASVVGLLLWYDGTIMMSRTQITLEDEMQRRARRRASDLGVSLAEYFRRLVARSEERRVGKECRSRWSRDDYR